MNAVKGTRAMRKKILVIHGPNLNLLGVREPKIYGTQTLDEINGEIVRLGHDLEMDVDTFQSNHEGEIVEKIHNARSRYQGLILNTAAYTHTSIAIRDAVTLLDLPVIEVHLSNIYKRETFRHHSLLADVVTGQITGFGANSYLLGLHALSVLV
jgi:3-dehydroquinate dehydratase II